MSYSRRGTDDDGVTGHPQVAEEGFVTSVEYPTDEGDEPYLTVESRFDSTPRRVYVPHPIASDTGVPREGQRVYFVRLMDDRGVFLGTVPDDHDGYKQQRRFDWPYTDAHFTFSETGNTTLHAHVDEDNTDLDHYGTFAVDDGNLDVSTRRNVGNDAAEHTSELSTTNADLTFKTVTNKDSSPRHTFKLTTVDANTTLKSKRKNGDENSELSLQKGNVILETDNANGDDVYLDFTDGDATLETEESQSISCTLSLKDGDVTIESNDSTTVTLSDTLTIDTGDGTTVTIDGGTVQIDGGTTPVVTDVTTTKDADGHVTDVSTTTSDAVHVP